MDRTGGTRARIQRVALELFTEQGYEKTSLREIAERLGVTKAALYYHFNSKEEIVNSFMEERLAALDELIEWAGERPGDPQRRREVLTRYAEGFLGGEQPSIMRFFEQNQTAVKSLPAGQLMRGKLTELAEALARGDDSPQAQLRATMALFAVHGSWFALRRSGTDDRERLRVALEVAYELLDRIAPA